MRHNLPSILELIIHFKIHFKLNVIHSYYFVRNEFFVCDVLKEDVMFIWFLDGNRDGN